MDSLRVVSSGLAAAAFVLAAGAAQAQQQLNIVTSLPKDLTEVYKRAFEAKNP
ncbi:MAG: ABC transporter substrate-binding protein, partial [Betaproteobacteria bacterium]|nr:ABC transporter substrate-binding protein [Betaproteobacteria bacterium]